MGDRPRSGVADDEPPVDREAITATLEDHPVRLAILFGSRVTGTADPASDVDIAIELSDAAGTPRTDVVMEVLVDLSTTLDRNDIDLSLVEDLKPRVGLAAFEHGELLLGSPERAATHRERFAREVETGGGDSLRSRLDRTIANVDRLLEGTR